jgi:hypothetical protein
MWTVWLALVAAAMASAQPALVRGVLLERDTQDPAGQFSIRATDNQVYRYQYDRKTYVEREDQLIDVRRLQPGEKVEVVSDIVPGSLIRYARTVHVVADAPPRRARRPRSRIEEEPLFPRTGDLTYSGVVFRLTAERLILHTRDGEQSLNLRKDTRYFENGATVDANTLKPNVRVFVRAGKDLYGQVEAYQVIWGKILNIK